MRSFGHLRLTPSKPFLLERVDDADAHGERQPGEESRALLEAPAEREREAAAGDRGPGAAATAPARGLPFGGERGAMDVATRRAAQQLARRRIELVDDLEVHRRRRAANAVPSVPVSADLVVELRRSGERPVLGERDAVLDQRVADRDGVEEVGRGHQPVAAAANPFERKPGRLGLPQKLRNAGARQPHLRGEVFAGVESAIRKLAQQGESERSKH